jgi:hypothetical protein
VVSIHTSDGKRIWRGGFYQGHCDLLAESYPDKTFYVLAASSLYTGDVHREHMLKWQIGQIQKGQYTPNGSDMTSLMFGPCRLSADSPRFKALRIGDELLYRSCSPAFNLIAWVKVTRMIEGVTDRIFVTPLQVYSGNERIALPRGRRRAGEKFEKRNFPALASELYN